MTYEVPTLITIGQAHLVVLGDKEWQDLDDNLVQPGFREIGDVDLD